MDRTSQPSDSVLAQRWQAGDATAAALVVERYANALGAIAYSVVRDVGLAEEVVQESMVRATQRIGTLRDGEKLGAFLIGIARNVAFDMMRHKGREAVLDPENLAAPDDPSAAASRLELEQRLKQAVELLSDEQREIFMLKYVSDLRYGEIAVTLGMTENAVAQKLWRIRQKLQKLLEDLRP